MVKNKFKAIDASEVSKTFNIDNDVKKDCSRVIRSIVSNSDNYSWVELNCFFRPWAILFESFYSGYFDLFLFYISYHSSFVPDGQFEAYSFVDFYRREMEDKFGLHIKKVEFSSLKEMNQKIKNEIDENSRILLPADLIGLSYSTGYKKTHHTHFFIIKGYDSERKIYFILDNMHIDGGASTIYKDFSIRFHELYHMSRLYLKHHSLEKNFFWALYKVNKAESSSLTIFNALFDHYEHFKQVNEGKSKIKYIENELINQSDINDDQLEEIIKRRNFKSVYYNVLFKFLSEAGIENNLINEFNDFKNTLENKWNKVTAKAMYKLKKKDKNFEYLKLLAENNILDEKSFREKYIDMVSKLNLKKLINEQAEAGKDVFVERNYNKAVIIKDENKIKIIHSREKKYDTWTTEDNAPQMLIYQNGNSNFSIEAKVTITSKIGNPFLSGIIVKFKSGVKIMFGNSKGSEIGAVCPEKNDFALYVKPYTGTSVYLKVERNSSQCIFYCKDTKVDKWEKQFAVEFTDHVECFGFFSRTWEFAEHQVEFSDISYREL